MESFDWVAAAVRVAAFVAALQTAGMALFLTLHRATVRTRLPNLVALARVTAVAGLVLMLCHQALEAARLAGEWPGLWDLDVERANWHRTAGASALVAALGLALMGCGLGSRRAGVRALAVVGAAAVAGSFALTGHTTGSGVPAFARAVLVLHVGLAAYWLGSIVALLFLAQRGAATPLEATAAAFSAWGVWLVPAILPLGIALAALLLPNLRALDTVYGGLLAAKLSGFILLLTLAAFNRWRVLPALRDSRAPAAARQFRRTLLAEYALLAAVLAVTAVMTSFYSWHE
jgi:putative copper resistance protein D